MNLVAISLTDLFKCSWMQGCTVILIGVWSFLALLGIRNARFPWRILGGLGFVVGSTLWLGLHPDLNFDTGMLGFAVRRGIFDHMSSPLALTSVSALLLVCSVIGLLVAVDWLPLLPFAPMLALADERNRRLQAADGGQKSGATRPPASLSLSMSRGTAATLAPDAQPIAPAAPFAAAPTAIVAPPTPLLDEPEGDDESDEIVTNWARFRPRLRDSESDPSSELDASEEAETGDDLPVDIGSIASHNSSTLEGESRPGVDDAVEVAVPAAPREPGLIESEEKKEDAPVPDREDEIPLTDAQPNASTAVAEPDVDETAASEAAAPLAEPLDETLAPRRKKEEEDEPAEEPGEPGEEGDEGDEDEDDDDDEGDEKEDDEEADDEDWDDEDAEEEDDDELDEEEDEEEEEEEEEKEEDDAEEDDDEDDDWDDDDDDDDDDDEDDEDGGEDDKEKSSVPDAPSAPSVPPVIFEVLAAGTTPAGRATIPASLFTDLPDDERVLLVRAVDTIAGTESVSLSRLQRELGVTYYSAARVFERLEKEGFVAPYTGSLAREVRITREGWEARRSGGSPG